MVVFGWVYWGANLGAAFGPALGTLAGAGRHGLPFVLAGFVVLVLAGVGFFTLRGLPAHHVPACARPGVLWSLRGLQEGLSERVMLYFLFAQVMSGPADAQLETTLGQYVGPQNGHGRACSGT